MDEGLRRFRFFTYHEAWLAVHQLEDEGFRAIVCEEAVGHLWGPAVPQGFCVWAFRMPDDENHPLLTSPPGDLISIIRAMIGSLIAMGIILFVIFFWKFLLLLLLLLPLFAVWAGPLSRLAQDFHLEKRGAWLVILVWVFFLYPVELVVIWLLSATFLPRTRDSERSTPG